MMLAPAVHCGLMIVLGLAGATNGVQRRWGWIGMGNWNLHLIFSIPLELELEQDRACVSALR